MVPCTISSKISLYYKRVIIIRGSNIYSIILSRTTITGSSSSNQRTHRLLQQHTSSKSRSTSSSRSRWRHSSLRLNIKSTIEAIHPSLKRFKWHQDQTSSDNNSPRSSSTNQRYNIRQKCPRTPLTTLHIRASLEKARQEVGAVLITGD